MATMTTTKTVSNNSQRHNRFIKDMTRVRPATWEALKNTEEAPVASKPTASTITSSNKGFAMPLPQKSPSIRYILPKLPAGISIKPNIVPPANFAMLKRGVPGSGSPGSVSLKGKTLIKQETSSGGKGELYAGGMFHLRQRTQDQTLRPRFRSTEDDDGYNTSSTTSSYEHLPTKRRPQSLLLDRGDEMEGAAVDEDIVYRFETRRKPQYVTGLPMDLEISEIKTPDTPEDEEFYEEDSSSIPAAIAMYGNSDENDTDGESLIINEDSTEMLSGGSSPGPMSSSIRQHYIHVQPEMEMEEGDGFSFSLGNGRKPKRGRPKNSNPPPPSPQSVSSKSKKYMNPDVTDPTVRNAISARRNRERKKLEFMDMKDRAEAAEYENSHLKNKLDLIELQYQDLLETSMKAQEYSSKNVETMRKVFEALAPEAMKKFGKKITAQVTTKEFAGKDKTVKLYHEVEGENETRKSPQQQKKFFTVDIHRGDESMTLHYDADKREASIAFEPTLTFRQPSSFC